MQLQKKDQWPDEHLTEISSDGKLLINLIKHPEARGVLIQQYNLKLFNPVNLTIRNAVEELKQVDREDPQSMIVLYLHGRFHVYSVLPSHYN